MPVQTRASARRAAQQAAQPAACARLLTIPGPAQQAVLALLGLCDRRSLRLACKAAAALVDEHKRRLSLKGWAKQLSQSAQLQQRYPSVEHLMVDGARCNVIRDSDSDEEQGWDLEHMQPWPAISTLTLSNLSIYEVQVALAGCSNIRDCCVKATYHSGGDYMDEMCLGLAALTALTKLDMGEARQAVGDGDVLALSCCQQLASLDLFLGGGFGANGGFDSLLGMQQLASLRLRHADLPAGFTFDFHSLAALTSLDVRPYSSAAGEASHHACQSPRLPGSLSSLTVSCLPMTALAAAPQLTSLQFGGHWMPIGCRAVACDDLAALAASCPLLATLVITTVLHLTPQCHSAPLLALTQLQCLGCVVTEGSARLSKVAPQLQELNLPCDLSSLRAPRMVLFEGATALRTLELCFLQSEQDLMPQNTLEAADFGVLAGLPGLADLRLAATRTHVKHVSQLKHLLSLEWVVWETSVEAQQCIRVAFGRCNALEQLRSCTFAMEVEGVLVQPPGVRALTQFVSAALGWLARAPQLAKLQWKADEAGPAALSGEQLRALAAASPSIRQVDVVHTFAVAGVCAWHPDVLHAVQELLVDGVEVVLDGCCGYD